MGAEIWIHGSSGLVGQALVKVSHSRGISVSRWCRTLPANSTPPIQKVRQDLSLVPPRGVSLPSQSVEAASSVKSMVILGWGNMSDPMSAIHTRENVQHVYHVAEVAINAGASHVIFAGSVDEYGHQSGLIREDTPAMGVLSSYAIGKTIAAEQLRELCAQRDCTFTHVRISNVYGSNPRIGTLLRQILDAGPNYSGPPLKFSTSGNVQRDHIYVDDVASALVTMTLAPRDDTVNVASGKPSTIRDLVHQIWGALGNEPGLIQFANSNEANSPGPYFSIERARRIFGWYPHFTNESGASVLASIHRKIGP